VRRLADELGVALTSVAGTGPGGRILKEDVEHAVSGTSARDSHAGSAALASAPPSVKADPPRRQDSPTRAFDVTIPLRGLRRSIAKNMSLSWRTVPHITDWRPADAANLIEARDALRRAHPDVAGVITFLPIMLKIVATSLVANPLMNASVSGDEEGYVLHSQINLGIATSTPDGLLVPVVRDADRKSVVELAVETAELIELTRARKASTEQLTGGTYTVNNVGALGGTTGSPIIRPPEVGILGFGRITDTVVARDGHPVVRPVMMLSSVGDHRLHDGQELSTFTKLLVDLIENPYQLLGTLR
jgi:pyruvate dehydrogenase E2 component (dihydrolipoamide acetyltransferase)